MVGGYHSGHADVACQAEITNSEGVTESNKSSNSNNGSAMSKALFSSNSIKPRLVSIVSARY